MATRRPRQLKRRIRPGFEPRRRGGGFSRWVVGVGVGLIVVAVIVMSVILPRRSGAPLTPTVPPTSVTVPVPVEPTDTPMPSATPKPPTRPCTVKGNTRIYSEPNEDSVGQDLARGKIVQVIDTVESDGRTWYRVTLPGYDDVRYVLVEAVECKP